VALSCTLDSLPDQSALARCLLHVNKGSIPHAMFPTHWFPSLSHLCHLTTRASAANDLHHNSELCWLIHIAAGLSTGANACTSHRKSRDG
jgi:hypothetical protein